MGTLVLNQHLKIGPNHDMSAHLLMVCREFGSKMTSKEKKKSKKPKEFVEDYDQNRKIVEAIAARPENNYCFDCNAHGTHSFLCGCRG